MANFTDFLALPPNKKSGVAFCITILFTEMGKGMYCPDTVFKISMI